MSSMLGAAIIVVVVATLITLIAMMTHRGRKQAYGGGDASVTVTEATEATEATELGATQR